PRLPMQTSTMTEQVEEKTFGVEQIVKIVGLAASVSLPASILFDWGFFGALGMSLRQVPTSLVDHAKSAVFWFPFVILMGVSMTVSEMLVVRFTSEMGPSLRAVENESRDIAVLWRKVRQRHRRLFMTVAAVGIAFIIAYLVAGDAVFLCLVTGISMLWSAFAVWSVAHPGGLRRWSANVITLIVFGPPAALMLWGIGHIEGMGVHFAPLSTRITVTGAPPQNVAVIRYLDKGLLARTKGGDAEFFQWSALANVDTPSKFDENDGLLCSWLHRCYWNLPDHFKDMR
ncbi:hypothetical protein, partial [Paraburkholderia sediminicola]|uniref:hypothetical protein n=1 Tax=Paraburkholderia sediminicola TaxID=458836 RepID=UPI0038BBF885